MRCITAPAPLSKAVLSQNIPCGFRVLFEQIRPWGPKTEGKKKGEKKKRNQMFTRQLSNSPPLCLSSVGAHSSKDAVQRTKACVILGQAQSPHHPCTYSQNQGSQEGRGKDCVKEVLICKSNEHLVCTSAGEMSVSRLHKRGCSPSVPQHCCHPSALHPPRPSLPHGQLSNPKGDYLAPLIAEKRLVLHPMNSQGNPASLGILGKLWLSDGAVWEKGCEPNRPRSDTFCCHPPNQP